MKFTDKQIEWGRWLVIVILIGVLGFFQLNAPFAVPPTPSPAASDFGALAVGGTQPAQTFKSVRTTTFLQNDGTLTQTGAASFASTVSVTGAQTNASTLSVTGSTTLSAFLSLAPSTAITVTNGNSFTPTASYQQIQAAGTVTPTIAVTNAVGSAYTNGTILRLLNVSNQTINIADSGNVKLSSAWAGGQYDSLTLIFDTTTSTWIEMSRSDN